jgi:hypothetical protein
MGRLLGRAGYVLANVVVMVILHGNSRQFWPKVPYLSLRDESTGEHMRLLFNTLAITGVAQAALGRLPRARWLARALTAGVIPAALPALLFVGRRGLRLRGQAAEVYNLALVPLLPIAALVVEDGLAAAIAAPATGGEPRG